MGSVNVLPSGESCCKPTCTMLHRKHYILYLPTPKPHLHAACMQDFCMGSVNVAASRSELLLVVEVTLMILVLPGI